MSHFKTIERDGKYITRNKYDVQFHGAQPRVRGHPGPLVQRLQSFPLQRLVVGPRGYCGGDINELLSTQARSRAELVQGDAEEITFSKV